MRFAYTDDQLAFAETINHVLGSECAPATLREAADAPAGALDRRLWNHLSATGLPDMLAPEADGGLGLDATWAVPTLVETGRFAVPLPILETLFVSAPFGVTGMATSDLGGLFAPCALDADRLVTIVEGRLVAFEPDEVALAPVRTVDPTRRAATITPRGAGTILTDDPGRIDRLVDSAVVGAAAQLCGLAQQMLDLTCTYVQERHQFGRPIGSFQAIKHHLADALLRLEFARPAVDRAAHTVAQGTDEWRERDVSMAKVLAADAAEFTAQVALQSHGAIGYTTEHDLHFYMKRTWALIRSWGDQNYHYGRIERALRQPALDL